MYTGKVDEFGKERRKSKQSSTWTQKEDKILRELKEVQKLGWREILTFFPDRTPNACQFRWRRIISGTNSKETDDDKDKPSPTMSHRDSIPESIPEHTESGSPSISTSPNPTIDHIPTPNSPKRRKVDDKAKADDKRKVDDKQVQSINFILN